MSRRNNAPDPENGCINASQIVEKDSSGAKMVCSTAVR